MAEMQGREALLSVDSLLVRVRILAVRENYGRTDYLITPVNGTGQVWKQAHKLAVISDAK